MSSRGRRPKVTKNKTKYTKLLRRSQNSAKLQSKMYLEEPSDFIEDTTDNSMPCERKEASDENNHNPISDKSSKILDQRLKAKERMAKKRADPEYAMKERERAREAKAKKRKDPAFLEFERARNREMMALKRQDPEYASRERERARILMALKRKDEDFARVERAMNKHRIALKRRDPDYRAKTIRNENNSDLQS